MLLQTSPMFYSFSLCPGGQTLKQQTWYIWSLWCFDKIAHTPSLFSTSFSTVSFSPDDCAPSVSTTLGYRALASEECVHLCQATWCGCGRGRRQPSSCASEWPSLWVTPPRERLLTASLFLCLIVAPMEPPAVTMPGGSVCLIPLPNTKRGVRGVKINSSLNKFVKSASKGVQHLLWHSCRRDMTLRMWRITWQIARMLLRKKVLLLSDSWLKDRSWLTRHTNHNANQ